MYCPHCSHEFINEPLEISFVDGPVDSIPDAIGVCFYCGIPFVRYSDGLRVLPLATFNALDPGSRMELNRAYRRAVIAHVPESVLNLVEILTFCNDQL